MSKVVDLFGVEIASDQDVDATSRRDVVVDSDRNVNWTRVLDEQICPFSDRKCYKVRKSQPDVSIGTCTMEYGRDATPIIICPLRLLERRQVFVDCLHLLHEHRPGNEFHVVSEVSIPGGSVDYFLTSVLEGCVKDFVGIELQTMDTTGTVWPERQRLLRNLGFDVDDADVSSEKPYGMNWKHTAKTTLIQLHHKVRTFEYLKRHLVLVVQDQLLNYMRREFVFDHLDSARDADPMHFHSYRFERGKGGNRVLLDDRLSTDANGIATCLGLQAEPNVEMEAIVDMIEAKLSPETVFNLT